MRSTPPTIRLNPTFPSWGPATILNSAIIVVLFLARFEIADGVVGVLSKADGADNRLFVFPYWLLFAAVPAVLAARSVLWAVTTEYEIEPDRVRIINGGLVRREQCVALAAIRSATFEQNILEALLGVGRLVLSPYSGPLLRLEGVPRPGELAERIRTYIANLPPSVRSGSSSPSTPVSQPVGPIHRYPTKW